MTTKSETKRRKKPNSAVSPEAQFLDYVPNPPEPTKAQEPVAEEPGQPQADARPQPSPLDNAGPMPAELLRDPFAVEVVPITRPSPPPETKSFTQERLVWITAVAVSWSVTVVAILRALRII